MKRVLITGMSGTGKSTVIAELAARGYNAVDTDYGGLSEVVSIPHDQQTGLGRGQDWVLILEDAEAKFPTPGTVQ